jgi:hypothetical protein
MRTTNWLSLATTAALSIVAACAPAADVPPDAPPPAPNVVTVTTTDHAFDVPSEMPAGVTTFKLINNGNTFHHVLVVRLDSGKTYDDLMTAMKNPGPPPAWAVFMGGPNSPNPMGGVSTGTVELAPGNYAMICMVDVPGGVPHIAHGMSKAFTVTAAAADAPAAPAPTADIKIELFDYNFTVTGELAAGKHVVEVIGAPGQPHEIVVAKMQPGKTSADLLAWMGKEEGPPPADIIGGTTPAAPGLPVWFDLELAPGNYAFLCFIPDAKDGKPHFMHGMVRDVVVQ